MPRFTPVTKLLRLRVHGVHEIPLRDRSAMHHGMPVRHRRLKSRNATREVAHVPRGQILRSRANAAASMWPHFLGISQAISG